MNFGDAIQFREGRSLRDPDLKDGIEGALLDEFRGLNSLANAATTAHHPLAEHLATIRDEFVVNAVIGSQHYRPQAINLA